MFRDDRDALQYRADALEQKVKEKSQEAQTLQQENEQLKKKLSRAAYGDKPPFWATRTFFIVALLSVVMLGGAVLFWGLRSSHPRTELIWEATLKTNEGVMVQPETRCTVVGTFWISGENTYAESIKISCGGQLLKNTVYPFGGEGWRLIEEKHDNGFAYKLQQATGDFQVDSSTGQAFLYSNDKIQELVASFEIDALSNTRRGDSLFAEKP